MAKINAYSLEASISLGFDNKSLKQANQQIKREAARLQQTSASASKTFNALMASSGAAFGAIAGGFAIGATAASKFEESFVQVKKTLNIDKDVKNVEKAFKQISDSLINISKIVPVTTRELNEIAAVGGQLGVAADDIVSFTKTIQKLTVATNLGAQDAALAMARLQEITGLTSKDLDNLGASLVDLGNNFAATESEIVNAAMQIATATAQIKGELNNAAVDALAFSTALRAIGQPAQAGATSIVRLMTEASQAVAMGGEKLETFAKVAGLSMQDFTKLFGIDSTRALALFIKGLDDTSKLGVTNVEILAQLGLSQVRTRKSILALSKANETLFDAIDTANTAYVENQALTEEAERRYDTLAMKIQQLKNIASAGILEFGQDSNSLEGAKTLVDDLTNIIVLFTDKTAASTGEVNGLFEAINKVFSYVGVTPFKAAEEQISNFAKTLNLVVKLGAPLLLVARVFSTIATNVEQAAHAMGIFETTTETINKFRAAGIGARIAGGPSLEEDDLAQFGMRAFRGSTITMGDRLAGMIPQRLGGAFGAVTGKARRTENFTRKAFFQARPLADAFMGGRSLDELFPDKFKETIEDSVIDMSGGAALLTEEVELSAADITRQYEQSASMMRKRLTGVDLLRDITQDRFATGGMGEALRRRFQGGRFGNVLSSFRESRDLRNIGFGGEGKTQFSSIAKGKELVPFYNQSRILPLLQDLRAQAAASLFNLEQALLRLRLEAPQTFDTMQKMLKSLIAEFTAFGSKAIPTLSNSAGSALGKFTTVFKSLLPRSLGKMAADLTTIAEEALDILNTKTFQGQKLTVQERMDRAQKHIDDSLMKLLPFEVDSKGNVIPPKMTGRGSKLRRQAYVMFQKLIGQDGLEKLMTGLIAAAKLNIAAIDEEILKIYRPRSQGGGGPLATIRNRTNEQFGPKPVDLDALAKANMQGPEQVGKLQVTMFRFVNAMKSMITKFLTMTKNLFSVIGLLPQLIGITKAMQAFLPKIAQSTGFQMLGGTGPRTQIFRPRPGDQRALPLPGLTEAGPVGGPLALRQGRAITARRGLSGPLSIEQLLADKIMPAMSKLRIEFMKFVNLIMGPVNKAMFLLQNRTAFFFAAIKSSLSNLPELLRGFVTGIRDLATMLRSGDEFRDVGQLAQKANRRREAAMRLARQRDRVEMSAARGPRVADVRAAATRSIARRAKVRQLGENRRVIADIKRQLRLDKILNRRRQMLRDMAYYDDPRGDGTLFEADRYGARQIPSAPDRTGRFDPDAGKLIGADRDGTFGQAPPRAVIRMQQRVNEFYAKIASSFKKMTDMLFTQMVRFDQVIRLFTARIGRALIMAGAAFKVSGEFIKGIGELARLAPQFLGIGKAMDKLTAGFQPFAKAVSNVAKSSPGTEMVLYDPTVANRKDFVDKGKLKAIRDLAARRKVAKAANDTRNVAAKTEKILEGTVVKEGIIARLKERGLFASLKNIGAQRTLNREKMREIVMRKQAILDDVTGGVAAKTGRYRNTAKGRLDAMLDTFYDEDLSGRGNRKLRRVRRFQAMKGLDPDLAGALAASRLAGQKGTVQEYVTRAGKTIKVNQGLAQSFDLASASAMRFSGILKGFSKFFAVVTALLAALAPLIKLMSMKGAEARGMREFQNTLRDISDGFLEYEQNLRKVAYAQSLLKKEEDIFSIEKSKIAETLEKYIEDQNKALEAQTKQLSIDLGQSFIDNLLTTETDAGKGGLAKFMIDLLDDAALGEGEKEMKRRLAEPIGNALRGALENAEIPRVGDTLANLFFTDDGELSGMFAGKTRDVVETMMKGVSPLEFAKAYSDAFANVEGFDMAQLSVFQSIEGALDKYIGYEAAKGTELLELIASGMIFDEGQMGRSLLNTLTEGFIGEETSSAIGDYFKMIGDDVRKAAPDLSEAEIGEAVLQIATAIQTAEAIMGGSIANISSDFDKLPKNSEFVKNLSSMLNVYLDELATAGLLTEDQVLDSIGDVETQLSLYSRAMSQIEQETSEDLKKMQEEFGIAEEASLRLAMKAKEAFKEIKKAATDLGKPLEEAGLTGDSFGQILANLRRQRIEIEKYEKNIALLRARGFEFVSDKILSMGLSGRDLAEDLLTDTSKAQALEMELMRTAPDYATEIGVTDPFADGEILNTFENLGLNVTEGFIQGIENAMPQLDAAFFGMGERAVQSLKDALGIKSPSTEGLGVGENVAGAFLEGMKNVITNTGTTNIVAEEFFEFIESLGASAEQAAAAAALSGGFDNYGAMFQSLTNSEALDAIKEDQKAFGLITSLTRAERDRNQALLNINKTKQAYAQQLRREADLQDRIGLTLERLNKLEKEGKVGNVTVKERIGILQKLLSLREMEERAAGKYDARTALSIQEKEQEVNQLAKMFNKGVISQLEFQAAQEELSEMKGEFKTEEDKELFFLQLADTEAEYEKAHADALKIDQELVSTREQYFGLLDEQENMTLLVTTAQGQYNAALERGVEADMALSAAMITFNENAGAHKDTIYGIADAYGAVTTQIGNIVNGMKNIDVQKINELFGVGQDGSGIMSGSYDRYQAEGKKRGGDIVAQELIDNTIAANPIMSLDYFMGDDGMVDVLTSAGLLDEYKAFLSAPGQNRILSYGDDLVTESTGARTEGTYDPVLGTYSIREVENALNEQFLTDSDLNAIEGQISYLAGLTTDERKRVEFALMEIVERFLESLGINVMDNTILAKNLETVATRSGLDKVNLTNFVNRFGIGIAETFNRGVMAEADKQNEIVNSSAGQSTAQATSKQKSANFPPKTIVWPPTGQTRVVSNATDYARYKNDGWVDWNASFASSTGSTAAAAKKSAAQVKLTTYGLESLSKEEKILLGILKSDQYKFGGRIPDVSHLAPKKFAMGGRMQDHMMKRALVGEYGPEEVRFVPGSGFLVKPLTPGGRGNNTIVQNLSVNVTGIPVDNASARKAAIQIKKALTRLDKEGNAGGGVRNV